MDLRHLFWFGTVSLVHYGTRDLGETEVINIRLQLVNDYIPGTMVGTVGEIDANMMQTTFVNHYRMIGQVLQDRNVQTAIVHR